jgi:uncharacterized protein
MLTVAPVLIYLHGFASGPRSAKAVYLQERLQASQHRLLLPDLNQGDFYHLSLTRQLQQVAALLPPAPAPVYVIGSSLGGLTAAWLGQRCPQVQRLLLLAPAFNFAEVWLPQLGEQLALWQQQGQLPFYHYGQGQYCQLSYQFVKDLQRYPEIELKRPVPTLILHGQQDDVIPIQVSRTYAQERPWVTLQELDSNHSLIDCCDQIGDSVQTWFNL